ncbi:MAG: alpha/beta hydrolase family protein [Aminivibrio sp.]
MISEIMRKLDVKDFLNYRYLSRLTFAPGGRHAALVVSRPDWDENCYKSDIHLLDVESGKIRRLTTQGDAKSLYWLNEHELLFPALREGKDRERKEKGEKFTVFYRISVDGGESEEYFRVPYDVTDLKVIGNGHFALLCRRHPDDPDFTAMDEGERAKAYKALLEERDYEVLEEIPFWSNGEGFTSRKRSMLFLYDRKEGRSTPITDEWTNVLDFKVDENRIAFCAKRYEGKMQSGSGAFVYFIEKGETETLFPQAEYELDFIDFWQEGYLVKGSDMKAYGLGEFRHFFVIRNGRLERFVEMDEAAGAFTNSDCRYGSGTVLKVHEGCIYYTTVDHVENALRKIHPDGRVETLLKRYETVDGFDVYGDRILYYGLGPVSLQEVFQLEAGNPRRLSDFNKEALCGVSIQTPERCDAQGERETVEGFVLKPADFDLTQKYPAVLHIHGGPKTAFGNTFFHEAHFWSSLGYFVLFCNPWGSDGRGNRFADLRGQYGQVDYDDLMAFTDHCLEVYPQIDAARVAVTGGSYGGFMTNWIIGHTDRFRCAVSQRSIANWISKFGTTDIGYYFNADQQASTPWDNPEKAWWHSPMKYADRVKTPTLFIHSEEDYRCWLAEGLQMFTSLRYHGVEARLCMFRGENHELSRSGKPKHRVRRMLEIVNWFARHME